MKEIGLKLKGKREESGLSIKEVAVDLKVEEDEIKSLEDGIKDNFKDINILKELISNYAKYLGFDSEELLDEFNEYLFEQTSRISLDDINKALEVKLENEKDKVSSPYTIEKKEKNKFLIFGIVFGIVLFLIFFASYFIVSDLFGEEDNNTEDNVSYLIGGM